MPLRAVLDDVNDIDDGMRVLYVEQDGKFVLDIDETVREHPRVLSLSNAYRREQEARTGASERVKVLEARLAKFPDNFDPAEIEALRAAAAKVGDKGGDKGHDESAVARVREQIEKKAAGEIATRDARIKVLEGEINRRVIDNGLDSSLDEAGISTKFKVAARALLKERGLVKLVEDDGAFDAIVDTDMGPMPVREFVKGWAASDEGRAFVQPAEGGNAPGNGRAKFGEPNPFSKQHWNKTTQSRLYRDDRVKAERLAKSAGFADIDAANKASAPVPSA